MLVLLLAQVAPLPAAPIRPPQIIAISDSRPAAPRSRVEVTLRTPGGIVWTGALWVSPAGASSWRQSVQEPLPEQCGERWSAGEQAASVQLYAQRSGSSGSPTLTQVNASWSRATDAAPCGGTRSVELRQIVDLPVGETIVLKGDGGLVLELRRR